MIEENVTFHNGAIRLEGTLFKPDLPGPHPALVVLHSASGGVRCYPFYEHLKEYLPDRDVAVLIFDRRGSGESSGDFSTADFDDLAMDGAAAFRYLCKRTDIDPDHVGLYGISQGGWIAPIIATKEPDVAFLIIVSGCALPPSEQMDYAASYTLGESGFSAEIQEEALAVRHLVNEYFRGNLDHKTVKAALSQSENESWFEDSYLMGSARLPTDPRDSKWYYEMDYDPLPIWDHVTQPTLFLFGDRDRWVPIPESRSNYQKATSHMNDVVFVTLAEINHLMGEMEREDESQVSEQYLDTLWDWLKPRL